MHIGSNSEENVIYTLTGLKLDSQVNKGFGEKLPLLGALAILEVTQGLGTFNMGVLVQHFLFHISPKHSRSEPSSSFDFSKRQVVVSDSENGAENIEEAVVDSPFVDFEGDEVIIIGASISTLSKSVDFKLKNILSSISEEVGKLRYACEVPDNITLKRLGSIRGLLDRKEGKIAMHTASSNAKLIFLTLPSMETLNRFFDLRCTRCSGHYCTYKDNMVHYNISYKGLSRKWLFVGSECEGNPYTGSICRVPRTFVKSKNVIMLKRRDVKLMANLAIESRLVGVVLWVLRREPEGNPYESRGDLLRSKGKSPYESTQGETIISYKGLGEQQAERSQPPSSRSTLEGLNNLIFAVASAFSPQFRALVDKDDIEKVSLDALNDFFLVRSLKEEHAAFKKVQVHVTTCMTNLQKVFPHQYRKLGMLSFTSSNISLVYNGLSSGLPGSIIVSLVTISFEKVSACIGWELERRGSLLRSFTFWATAVPAIRRIDHQEICYDHGLIWQVVCRDKELDASFRLHILSSKFAQRDIHLLQYTLRDSHLIINGLENDVH
ncbi:hypothetical protein FNV43_RR07399 [Rhamnella rubrinervis]|uniref:Uncharacterized protein n=1 Tax=Rhamnella rubrinervis TaxID=2594499 RepID=A0A8K0HGG6_9ROSA|nr:hypothetical protein FNV43_RR07399 [Rhamnella rubrinervis]